MSKKKVTKYRNYPSTFHNDMHHFMTILEKTSNQRLLPFLPRIVTARSNVPITFFKRLNLKPPPPPSGDFELAMDLYLEERALEESDWNIASSCNNPRKKRKQSLITSFF